jgi:hypothetical protein
MMRKTVKQRVVRTIAATLVHFLAASVVVVVDEVDEATRTATISSPMVMRRGCSRRPPSL